MRIAILGYGVEGKSSVKFLKKLYPKSDFEIRDIKRRGKDYLRGLEKFDMVVRSPGIPYLLPEIQKAKKQGIEITSATKLFFANYKGKIIGITGTKGKGTVATLLYKILKTSGKDVYLVGNIGKPALDVLSRLRKNSIVVFELSSFQLQDLDRSPEVAVVLKITPDHLDYHKNFREYLNAKSKIASFQNKNDRLFYFSDGECAVPIVKKSKGRKIAVNPGIFSMFGPGDLRVPGAHNFRNAVMAVSVAADLGCNNTAILRAVKSFRWLAYHLEFIRNLRGVKYYNDSASTNPVSTIAAIKSFKERIILIMGGKDKGFNYGTLAKAILNSSIKSVLVIGENNKKIKKTLSGKIPIKLFRDLKSAALSASKISRSGSIVLFSPGAASFDMFKNAKERGARFTKLVESL